MKKLTDLQLADMAVVINKLTCDTITQIISETEDSSENDERIIEIACLCASQAVASTLAYLYELEEKSEPALKMKS